MFKTSTSRLPADHFISGALFGGMTATALEFYNNKQSSSKDKVKNISKFAIEGGIATSLSISASNNIVQKQYLSAAFDMALGIGLILAIENILKTENEK